MSAPVGVRAPPGQEIHQLAKGSKISMSKVTELASGQITRTDALTIDLVKPVDMPAVIMIRWPVQPTISDPRQFTAAANAAMRILATATTQLAAIRAVEY